MLLESTLGATSDNATTAARTPGELLSQRSAASWRVAETKLKNFSHEPVMALYVRSNKAMGELRRRLLAAGIELSEADVRPTDRFLMERFITGSIAVEISETDASEATTQLLNPRIKSTEFRPRLSALSFDIETDMKAEQLYSCLLYTSPSPRD